MNKMLKIKPIDIVTSLVAACLWLLGGIAVFFLVSFSAKQLLPKYGHSPKGAPIYSLIGLLLYAGFFIGAWLAVKWFLPLFIKVTKQRNLNRAVHKYIVFSWLSIFSLLLADTVAKNNLVINFGIWALVLASIYLIVKYKTVQ